MRNKHSSTRGLWFYFLLFAVVFFGFLFYEWYPDRNASFLKTGLIFFGAFLVIALIALLLSRSALFRSVYRADSQKEPVFRGVTLEFWERVYLPIVICDDRSRIIWFNSAFGALYPSAEALHGGFLDQFSTVDIDAIADEEAGITAHLKSCLSEKENSVFTVNRYLMSEKKKKYYVTVWNDKSDYRDACDRLEQQDDVVALIAIDNLEELMQLAPETYRIAAAHAETALHRFAESVEGILREYETDKFLLIFKAQHLPGVLESKFAVMDEIREIHADDNNPVTLSIGVAKVPGTLAEKEQAARLALDTALQRGGDQAVFRTPDNMEFYGGRTRTMHRRTKVRARVIANELAALITGADNVLIMGHKFPDHDCIGSCVGLARLCMFCGVDVKIATDKQSDNIAACLASLENEDEYRHVFVESSEICNDIRPGTLLIVSDVSTPANFEAPELYENVRNCVIIDHHRRSVDPKYPPLISYIEPSASSASELVAELLEQATPLGTIKKVEANLLFAGMLLDTDRFTRNTGVRTFAAAQYLRDEGAEPSEAKLLFRTGLDDYLREARFHADMTIYRDRFAIAVHDADDTTARDTVAAAKAANRMLTLQNIDASFALVRVGRQIHISARSLGEINVQLILETLGGGGHFDAAAARLDTENAQEAVDSLQKAIDRYLEER